VTQHRRGPKRANGLVLNNIIHSFDHMVLPSATNTNTEQGIGNQYPVQKQE
jgi:hypothetical protein